MPTSWTCGLELFAQILRRHGLGSEAVADVASAWSAFQEFVQLELDGIEPAEDDSDGFIVQWGRWSWNENRPALAFTRQIAVSDEGARDDEFRQPHLWAFELQLLFAEDPAWADVAELAWSDSMGFDFDPPGPERAAMLTQIAEFIETLPQVRAMWQATPVGSRLSLERVD
jgi:hypothetical protein